MSRKRAAVLNALSQLTQEAEEVNEDDEEGSRFDDIDRHINDLVYYIIARAGNQTIFRVQDMKGALGNIPKGSTYFQMVITKVTAVLQKVYGYNLIVATSGTQTQSKYYIVSNRLKYVEDKAEDYDYTEEDSRDILLLLILSHIFMSKDKCSEDSLTTFLESLNIHIERKHPVFGSIKEYINMLRIRKYITIEEDQHNQKKLFSWGPTAEATISKMDVLNFVAKMYNREPCSWTQHYREAGLQNSLNVQESTNPEDHVRNNDDNQ
ncbi:unnamed protein product [Callosobruchus maculatus]|uniref:MAGE domain-containing protein n=1 Tax=Callosobruchus maculatus TaxID=64391 RepID=A0A653D557_CALMS|nr:unnamed protein product [Callosobruchus maculatus]